MGPTQTVHTHNGWGALRPLKFGVADRAVDVGGEQRGKRDWERGHGRDDIGCLLSVALPDASSSAMHQRQQHHHRSRLGSVAPQVRIPPICWTTTQENSENPIPSPYPIRWCTGSKSQLNLRVSSRTTNQIGRAD